MRNFPWLLASVVTGALLLSVAAAAYPLFTSASTSRLVNSEIRALDVTRYGAGIAYRNTQVRIVGAGSRDQRGHPIYEKMGKRFAELAAASPLLAPTITSFLGPPVNVSLSGRPQFVVSGRFFSGTDATAHVHLLSGHLGDGVLLPDYVAHVIHYRTGDRITVAFPSGRSADLSVDGVYQSLYSEPRSGYWRLWDDSIYPMCLDCGPPPQFLLVNQDRFPLLARMLRMGTVTFASQAPIKEGLALTLDEASNLAQFAASVQRRISGQTTWLGRLFDCCQFNVFGFQRGTSFHSVIRIVADDVERRIGSIEGPGRVLQAAGIAVALLVLGAAGAFAQGSRRTESRLLWARGASPFEVGAKALIESALPCVAGAALGVAVAFALVTVVGPTGRIAGSADREALVGVGAASLLALGLMVTVAASTFVRQSDRPRHRLRFLARLPWEILILAVAAYAGWRLVANGGFVTDRSNNITRPSGWTLAFPVLALAGAAVLGARGFRATLRAIRDRSRGFPPAPYLAVHRLATGPSLATLLFVGASLCLGIATQAQTLVRSIAETVHAKAEVFVGADVQARIETNTPLPDGFPVPITRVTRRTDAGSFGTDGNRFDLLAVDSRTFTSGAYWNDSFSDVPLPEIMSRLHTESVRLPVVLVGAQSPEPSTIDVDAHQVPVDVIARAATFPGMSPARSLVVVDATSLEGAADWNFDPLNVGPSAITQLWMRGDPDRILAAVARLRYQPSAVLTAREVEDIPSIAAVEATFVVLGVLGLATAALVIVGLLMYLQSRQRSQLVAFGLSLRMGMAEASHRRALLVEIGAVLGSCYALGLVVALAAAFLMIPRLDPLQTIPPHPFFVVPVATVVVVFVVLVGVCWLGAWAMIRLARSRALGEVLRLAE